MSGKSINEAVHGKRLNFDNDGRFEELDTKMDVEMKLEAPTVPVAHEQLTVAQMAAKLGIPAKDLAALTQMVKEELVTENAATGKEEPTKNTRRNASDEDDKSTTFEHSPNSKADTLLQRQRSFSKSLPYSTAINVRSHYSGEKLKGPENYQTFKFQTYKYLVISKLDWWLANDPDTSSEDQIISHERAVNHYVSNVEGNMIQYLITARTVQEIANRLENMYGAKRSTECLIHMQKRLNSMKIADTSDEAIERFMQDSRGIYNMMLNMGSSIAPDEYISRLLGAIPDEHAILETVLASKSMRSIEEAEMAIKNEFWKINQRKGSSHNTSNPSQDISNRTCYKCGKKGHFRRDCKGKKKSKDEKGKFGKNKSKSGKDGKDGKEGHAGKDGKSKEITFVTIMADDGVAWAATHSTDQQDHVDFLLDSCSNIHLCKEKWAFATLKECPGLIQGTGGHCRTEGLGTIKVESDKGYTLTIEDVRYAPDAGVNILSLSRFTRTTKGSVKLSGHKIELQAGGEAVITGTHANGLYQTTCKVRK